MRPVQMIPIHQIHVLNPRSRNRRQHKAIIDNIALVGLKRPITVSRKRREEGELIYDLVCGQGRLEAYRALSRLSIPAFVVEAGESKCMVMSLVENIARRQRPAIEIMHEIGVLHQRGYSDLEIGRKIGMTSQWVGQVVTLLTQGEERLVAAVETGLVPISLAVNIARSDDTQTQQLLAEAYTSGVLRGKKLALVRRLLEQRSRKGKVNRAQPSLHRGSRKLTVENLRRIYEREVEKQQILIKKADVTQSRLLFVIQALQELRKDEGFTEVLRKEGIDSLPRALAERMT
ncbi:MULTISPECIES: plasmid partitioning protein RepB C-terminal domain-containing protein [unclassified Lysobacter]|uniref:plasmid partitioning protein RepB C-terminal domain-containing protein n=1 Tax=unclassified Lysobacter TaxID=2635362 RepID=UPI001BE6CD2E|nr:MULTISPECIES: plasmid partitioning protein RepB C-terminal domain-containing protein [unclassified Lysobacter]MBT2748274.1 ParB N-terminal domain-containing protein [Lysobacter sp. ISL-42]MBT2749959.1 ParB N-terminal domain-containing protein [Lysobacter sp. ISL-50]MBT2781287.1 ParB N-terminal domain-containing protein [Lysobacter sp. ISL-52]